MGCGCNGGAANAAAEWIVRFADGTVSPTRYPDEAAARIALARTGKTGIVKSVAKK